MDAFSIGKLRRTARAAATTATIALTVLACRPATPQPADAAGGMPRPRSHDAAEAAVASADGVPIRYHAEGSGEPALVFIHGWSGNRGQWAEQVARFSADREVIALDLAGHGESGHDRHDWTIASLGADVHAVVSVLGLRRVILIGHALGGPVALEAASRMPDRVAAVIGIDSFQDVERRSEPARAATLLASWEKDFAGAAQQLVDADLPQDCEPALRERLRDQLATAPPEIALPLLRAEIAYDEAAAFERVHMPIRAIETTRPADLAAGRRHTADFAVVDLTALRLGHFPMLTAPDLFDQKLAETLAALPSRSAGSPPAIAAGEAARPGR